MNETTNQKYTRPKPAWLRLAFIYVIIFVVALSFAVGYLVGAVRPNSSLQVFTDIVDEAPSQLDDKTVDFSLFWDIWNSLKDGYLRQPISERDAFYGSLKGMVASLDDPYSTFLDPAETKEFDSEINGQFEGIGAEIGLKDERIVIIAPLPNSPAEEAGARAGDVIETIDGQTTIGMSVDEAVHLIRGQKGTAVELVVLREGSEEVIELTIERDTITTTSVSWRMIDDTIAYVLVTSFSADTLDQFNQAITELLVEEPAGFILDLRGNPGGFLDVAVEFTGEFIDGQVVVIEKFGEGEQIEHSSERPSRLPDIDT
ncbi:MAG: PDZ domain-containing protein, partial [bacterium]|nr:PDZ domain-containing protein [bacterium]